MWQTRGYGLLLPLLAVTLALLFAEVPARETGDQPVQQKKGIFSRLSRSLQAGINLSNILPSAPVSSSVSSAVVEDDPEDKAADNQPSIDVWKEVPVFKVAQRMLKNDHYNVLSDMFAGTGIEKIWGDPKMARFLLDQNPMLQGFKGIQEISAKETLQPADGLKVVELMRSFMAKMPENVKALADPDGFAEKFRHYATLDDPIMKELSPKAAQGDLAAARQLQQRVADLEWDGLIDLKHFGLDGREPPQTKMMRELFMREEPDLFELMHGNDPYVKQHILDPTLAYKQAAEAAGITDPWVL